MLWSGSERMASTAAAYRFDSGIRLRWRNQFTHGAMTSEIQPIDLAPAEAAEGLRIRKRRSSRFPLFLKDLIACPPRHGVGVHQWLFKVARHLHHHRMSEDIVLLLAAAIEGCGRHVPAKEIREAVENSKSVAWTPPDPTNPKQARVPKWPACDPSMRRKAIASAGVTMADVRRLSPVPCTSESVDAEFYVDQLFPGNPLLCVGLSNSKFKTARREHFRGHLARLSLIVPSPMTALKGRRKSDGKLSAHTLDNTGERHYLITEFDSGTEDEQAALIWHLKAFAPLVLILWSGGKSYHAVWNCRNVSEEKSRKFMRYAVKLGADPATWTRSQFVRLPQGWRADKETRQEVAYFDPARLERGDG